MSDEYVLKSQKYLNSMYGGHPSWVTLQENGNTGTLMMEGLIRAFQIENNVPNATGYLGPYTVNVMKNLPKISKMSVHYFVKDTTQEELQVFTIQPV